MELTPVHIYIHWAGTCMDDLEATRKLAMPGIYVHQFILYCDLSTCGYNQSISDPASEVSDSICV